MNELALFTGAGGGVLASTLNGIRTICGVEIDTYARCVLVARQNDGSIKPFPVWHDIKNFDGKRWRCIVDIVSGGFPCQSFSTASRGRKTAENLWPEMRRVIKEVESPFVFSENVSKKAIDKAADDLDQMGYKTNAISLSAKDLGGDHIRRRYWLFAYSDNKGELLRGLNAEMGKLPELQASVWASFSPKPRVFIGDTRRMDSFRSTGNIQVPIVAATAFRILVNAAANALIEAREEMKR